MAASLPRSGALGCAPGAALMPMAQVERTPLHFGDYTRGEELGRGNFGRIFACQRSGSGERFAAKVLDLKRLQFSANIAAENKKIRREAEILERLPSHPNLVRFHGTVYEGDWLFFVLELVPEGDLFTALLQRPKICERARFCEVEACFVFRQLVDGLGHLHRHAIIHRDLKLENVLVVRQRLTVQDELLLDVKLADFGLSKIVGEGLSDATSTVGTPQYTAPEVLEKGGHDFRVDLWSLGVLLYVLLNGVFPDHVAARAPQSELDTMVSNLPVSNQLQAVVLGLLQLEPGKRLSIDSLQEHPWLAANASAAKDATKIKDESGHSEAQTPTSEATPAPRRRPSRTIWLSGSPFQADRNASSYSPKKRSRVSDERIVGEVKRWCGRYGWIQPESRISHPAAAKHCGDVFVHASDVSAGEALVEGMVVAFVVYIDADGLGAEQCRPVDLGTEADHGPKAGKLRFVLNKDEKEDQGASDDLADVEALSFHVDGEDPPVF